MQNWLRKTNLSLIFFKNVFLNESLEVLRNRSEIIRILVLAMTTSDDGMGGSNSV